MNSKDEKLSEKEEELQRLKTKIAQFTGENKWRVEATKLSKTVEKLTARLLKLEKDEVMREKYEMLRRQIEDTMRQDDEERENDHDKKALALQQSAER